MPTLQTLVQVIIALIVFVILVYIVQIFVGMLGLPYPIPQLIYLLLGVLGLVWLLRALGSWGP